MRLTEIRRFSRTIFLAITTLATVSLGSPALSVAREPEKNVFFVGNSVTYTNNLPAMLAGLSEANGKVLHTKLLAQGGEALAQHLEDPAVIEDHLSSGTTHLVVQERGGDLTCVTFNNEMVRACEASKDAHARLAAMANASGVNLILLGTYQSNESASILLERNELEVATANHFADYIDLSSDLNALQSGFPNYEWLAADGVHPGRDLTMLIAIRLYRSIFGQWPDAATTYVRGQLYGPDAKLSPNHVVLGTDDSAEPSISFSARDMRALIQLAADAEGNRRE